MPDTIDPDVYALAMLDALAEGDDDTADALLAEVGGDDVPPDATNNTPDAPDGDLLKSLPPRVAAAVRLHQQADDAGRAELVRLASEDAEAYERLVDDAVADGLFLKAEWDESKHARDHGKFSSKPGAGGGEESEQGGGATNDATTANIDPADLADGEDELRQWCNSTSGAFKGVTLDSLRAGGTPPGVTAVYRDTQRQLAEQGVDSLDLYRGVKLKDDGLIDLLSGGDHDFSRAASWSENEHTAGEFSVLYGTGRYPVVLHVEGMPADRIIASARTSGVFEDVERAEGFDGEGEALTAAGRLIVTGVTDRRGNEYDDDDIAEWVADLKAKKRINWPDGVTVHLGFPED